MYDHIFFILLPIRQTTSTITIVIPLIKVKNLPPYTLYTKCPEHVCFHWKKPVPTDIND